MDQLLIDEYQKHVQEELLTIQMDIDKEDDEDSQIEKGGDAFPFISQIKIEQHFPCMADSGETNGDEAESAIIPCQVCNTRI